MRRMAADARPRGRDRVEDLLGVAARARARRVVVRRVTGRALRVRLGGEHGTILVARGAGLDLRGAELVRRVAAGAFRVAQRAGRRADLPRTRLGRVTARAALVGGEPGLVDAMAVEAAALAGVLGLATGVALRARLGLERRRLVGAVAARARLIGVRGDRVDAALRLVVATQARRGRTMILAEAVAVLTARRRQPGVQRRDRVGVAARAQLGRRPREAAITMAVGARDLADVSRVARAGLDITIRDRHLIGDAIVAASAADGDHHEHEPAGHSALPVG